MSQRCRSYTGVSGSLGRFFAALPPVGPWLSQGRASDRLMDLGEESPFSLPPSPTPPFFNPIPSSGSWLHLAVAGRTGSLEFQKLLHSSGWNEVHTSLCLWRSKEM